MLSSSLLISTFLLISHWTTGCQANTIVHNIPDNDLETNCAFVLNGYNYDLCPLVGSERVVEDEAMVLVSSDNDDGKRYHSPTYHVALGTVRKTSVVAADSVCEGDAWICRSDATYVHEDVRGERALEKIRRSEFNRALTESVSIFRNEKGSSIFASVVEGNDQLQPPPVRLTFIGKNGSSQAKITFFCADHDALKFVSDRRHLHWFAWDTPHGCPTPLSRGFKSIATIMQEPAPEGDQDSQSGEQTGKEGLLPDNHRRMRPLTAFITLCLVFTLVVVSLVFSSARARHYTAEHLHSVAYAAMPMLAGAAVKLQPIGHSITSLTSKTIGRFRQDDSNLVRWAQEEMALDTEDMMVNGAGASSRYNGEDDAWDGDGLDEYIPLTISPKYGKGRRVRSYGATPEVETFAERGVMGGLGRYFKK